MRHLFFQIPLYLMDHKEAAFIERLRQRHPQAYEELYDRYSAAIYGLGMSMLRAEDLAKDAMQETFIRVWKGIFTYDPSKGRFFTWMLNIARNYCRDVIKSKEAKLAAQSQSGHEALEDNISHSGEMQVEDFKLKEEIASLLMTLSPSQRSVISALYFKGLSQSEAAKELDMPLGTVKSNVRLAMKHLRSIMVKEEQKWIH